MKFLKNCKKFKAQVENESKFVIKSPRIDKGKEFISMELNKLCRTNVTLYIIVVSYFTQQNKFEIRTWLNDKSEKYASIGYSLNSKGYKLFNHIDRKIVIVHKC
ncbi:hypothetical protein CR513_52448, partial [Mucuna pruriens]